MSHTPGPWTVHGGWGGMIKAKDGRFVAECRNRQLKPHEVEANMALIAAAPELLQALKELVDAVELADPGVYCLDDAKAAIAKAEGAPSC